MPNWLEILLLAVASAFWPTLIVVVVVALRLDHPIRILVFFVAGALLTTISIGLAIVFALDGTSVASGSNRSVSAGIYLVAGALSILAAGALWRYGGRPREPKPPRTQPSLAERSIERGAPVAFAAGVVLNIIPGTFPFVALVDIAKLDVGDAAKVAAVVVFYVIMLAFAEVPIVAYAIAPERTIAATTAFNEWLARNGRRVAAVVLAAVGAYLVVRGLVKL
ncbi:MAG TPA: GAP family protein [Gaiellaceae bacterium]|nr:GAP family protein [Gaiellaceae bacterium]